MVVVQVAEAAVHSVRSVAPHRGAAERTAPTPAAVGRAHVVDPVEAPAASLDTAAFHLVRTAVRRKAGRPGMEQGPVQRRPSVDNSAAPVSRG